MINGKNIIVKAPSNILPQKVLNKPLAIVPPGPA